MRSRHTTPPKVLPLLPLGVLAIFIGSYVVGIGSAVLVLTGVQDLAEDDDLDRGNLAIGTVFDLLILVALVFVFRWAVERWVARYVPRQGPD